MVTVTLEVTGADQASKSILEVADQFDQPLTPLLDRLTFHWTLTFQSHITDDGPPGVTWPKHHPVTTKIREYYGHGVGPRLMRAGDLRNSITTLRLGPDFATVGTPLPFARVVQDGGTVTEGGRTRQVQAFPFIVITDELSEVTFESIESYFFGAPV